MRTRLAAMVLGALSLTAVACAGPADLEEDDEGFTLDALSAGSRPFRPDLADTSAWAWQTRSAAPGGCATSPQAAMVAAAVRGARHSNDVVPPSLLVTTRNASGPALLDSSEMFPALGGLVANAQHEVDLQWHIVDADSDGFHDVIGGIEKLHERLAKERAAGARRTHPVKVRIITPDWALRPGNSVQKYASAIRTHAGALDPSLVELEVAAHRYYSLAVMHVKMGVIDGTYVHVGGGNLSHHQNYHDGVIHERDSAYVVKGDVAKAALAQFDDLWTARATTSYACNAEKCKKQKKPLASHVAEVTSPDLTAAGVPADACLPMIFMVKRASENVLSWDADHAIGKGFKAAFGSSTKVLRISSPNLNDRFMGPIIDAAKTQGTEVRLMLPQTFNELVEALPYFGGGTNRMASWWLVTRIGKENVGVGKTLDLRWFSVDGRTPQRGGYATGGRHIKYYSVDDQLAIIGSTNLDKQSMSRSREVGIAVDDATTTKAWDAKIFDADFAKAIPILKEQAPNVPEVLGEESMDNAPTDDQADFLDSL